MDREQLISVVELVRSGEEDDQEKIFHILGASSRHVPHPLWAKIIFEPPPELGENPTAAQIVDYALAYKAPEE